jgi:replicative DNA helicase
MTTYLRAAEEVDPAGFAPSEVIVTAEAQILGTLLELGISGRDAAKVACAEIVEACPPEVFYRPGHQVIASAARDLVGGGQLPDPVAVGTELGRRGDLARVGGLTALHDLQAVGFIDARPALDRAALVRADAERRRWHTHAKRVLALASDCDAWGPEDTHGEAIIEWAMGIGTAAEDRDRVLSLSEDVELMWDELFDPPMPHIVTGLADLDRHLLLDVGDITTLAARTSVGKSLVAGIIARNVAIDQCQATFFSAMEMSRKQMVRRHLAALARVRHERFSRPGMLDADDRARLVRARDKLDDAPLYTDYADLVTLAHLRQRLGWMARRHGGIGLVVVD